MDHEYRPVIVQHKGDLKEPISPTGTPDEVLTVGAAERIWATGAIDDDFGLFGIDAMALDVVAVPLISSELHSAVLTPATRLLF